MYVYPNVWNAALQLCKKAKFGSLVIILCMVLMELLAILTTIILKVKLFILSKMVQEWELFLMLLASAQQQGH